MKPHFQKTKQHQQQQRHMVVTHIDHLQNVDMYLVGGDDNYFKKKKKKPILCAYSWVNNEIFKQLQTFF